MLRSGHAVNHIRARRLLVLLAIGAVALGVSQAAAAHGAGAHREAARASVAAAIYATNDPAGEILTTKAGRVFFTFPKDKPNKNVCQETPKCATDWPALTTTGAVTLGPGVKRSLVKLIPFKGKLKQVTYAGHPLHLYKFDDGPSVSFTFIGIKQFGARWDALTPKGKLVTNPGG